MAQPIETDIHSTYTDAHILREEPRGNYLLFLSLAALGVVPNRLVRARSSRADDELFRVRRVAAGKPGVRGRSCFPARASVDFLYPLILLATAAAIIASQAIISGAFSLTIQAVQLGFLPRPHFEHRIRADLSAVGQLGADGGLHPHRYRL